MRGLRTQESEKFNIFFALIQKEAEKKNHIFYADAGDGNDFETEDMEGENMMGWLIPTEKAPEFESLWKKSEVGDEWADFYVWAVWSKEQGNIRIHFEQ